MPRKRAMDTPKQSKNLSEDIYSILKKRIINWDYLPNHRFTEMSLSEEFNVSRSPIREALKTLEQKGLINKESNIGYEVKLPNIKEVNQYYEFRIALELYVVEKLATEGMDQAVWQKLAHQWRVDHVSNYDLEDNETLSTLDEAFHEELARCVDNTYLLKQLIDVNERLHFVRMTDITSLDRLQDTAKQHLTILNCIHNKDVSCARRAMKKNIEEGQENVDLKIREALSHAYLKSGQTDGRL